MLYLWIFNDWDWFGEFKEGVDESSLQAGWSSIAVFIKMGMMFMTYLNNF